MDAIDIAQTIANHADPAEAGKPVTTTKEEAVARRNAPKQTPSQSHKPKRKAIAKTPQHAKAKAAGKTPKVAIPADHQKYLVMRGNGKGTYALVESTQELYETSQHGYVTKIFRTDHAGEPTGKNMAQGGKFKTGKVEFALPAK
jgi:DNA mismatch repair ATPase MutL